MKEPSPRPRLKENILVLYTSLITSIALLFASLENYFLEFLHFGTEAINPILRAPLTIQQDTLYHSPPPPPPKNLTLKGFCESQFKSCH